MAHKHKQLAVEETNHGQWVETVYEDEEYKVTRDIITMLDAWQPGPAQTTTVHDWPIRVVEGIVAHPGSTT